MDLFALGTAITAAVTLGIAATATAAALRPRSWGLPGLAAPLAARRADVVNGYRWQAPQAVSLPTAIGATIDRAIATLPRLDRFRLLWGGSLALTRQALDRIDASA